MLMPKSYRQKALSAIVSMAEEGRLKRASNRPIFEATWNGCAYTGVCIGSKDKSYPHITLSLKIKRNEDGSVMKEDGKMLMTQHRSFGCNCWDHLQRAKTMGPCKHVISLAQLFLNEDKQGEADAA